MTATTRQALDRVLRDHFDRRDIKASYAALLDALVAALPETEPDPARAFLRWFLSQPHTIQIAWAKQAGYVPAATPREAPTDQRLLDTLNAVLAMDHAPLTRTPTVRCLCAVHEDARRLVVSLAALATEGEPT